ncbi:putative transcriptional regulator, TetR family protein [Nocardia neocaledoniensis NBRC 108232]|uniref:TetR family transcriptional regulator n=1 Tax=Nocardia neocaledoniensis TaxID=236511 RepID=A0A317N2H8_9NOCA|nr:TetR/AcrR family transcriptional regulator [Nocardia neocaledoniensis]PWV67753.1 TetR family transcriptional regulator [Nocardia neocaledoniensis]GEM31027.1 putative transcriptional regulator, TetR family protein [Nocardia neocaledoniensis NBRC 108232]
MVYVKASEREEQIIAAAIKVLSDVGVPAATLRAVAAEAGVPLGTLQYVFPSKDQLLRAVIATVVEEISGTLREGLELDRGVEHALRHGVTSFWEKLVAHRIGLQIMQYELMAYSLRSETAAHLARLQYDRYCAVVTEFCEQAAQAAGERCAVGFDTLGRLVLAQVDGLILQHVANPDAARARRDLDNAVDMLVLFADPQRVARGSRRSAAAG